MKKSHTLTKFIMIALAVFFMANAIVFSVGAEASSSGIGFTEPETPKFSVTVENSFTSNDVNGSGLYEAGDLVTIRVGNGPAPRNLSTATASMCTLIGDHSVRRRKRKRCKVLAP